MTDIVSGELLARQTPIAFYGHARAKPGSHEALLELMTSLGEPSRDEPGVLVYELHLDPADAGRIVFYELYADGAAVKNHLEQPHMQRFFAESAALLQSDLDICVLEPIGLGPLARE